MSSAAMTGGEALARLLTPEDVPFVFGVAGGKLGRFLQAISRQTAIRYVGARHESAAALMAAGVFAGSNRMAVAVGEAGPGGAYLAAGIAQAYGSNLAVLAITSNNQQAASYPGRGMFMEQDNLALFAPITKWNAVVHDGRRLPELVREAFRQALSGRPGPVHLDIPHNVLNAVFPYRNDDFTASPATYRPLGRPRAAAGDIESVSAMLRAAERPLLIAGGGVARAGAAREFRALATSLGAPIMATQMGIGVAPSDSPLFIGHGGIIGGPAVIEAMRRADVVLCVGCRLSSWLWDQDGSLVRPPTKLIQVDIDPAMIGRATPVALGIVADAKAFLTDLQDACAGVPAPPDASLWLKDVRATYGRHRAALAALAAEPGEPIHPASLAQAIADALPDGALMTFDGAHTSFWSNDFTPASEPMTRLHDPGLCQIGFGLPYAISLALLNPARTVINITGDGAFGFTLAELDTARREGAKVITVIHNNQSWGVIAQSQKLLEFSLGTALGGADYARIAQGFGCYGETVLKAQDFAASLRRAMQSGCPAVLDCATRFEPHPAMPAFGKMSNFGIAHG